MTGHLASEGFRMRQGLAIHSLVRTLVTTRHAEQLQRIAIPLVHLIALREGGASLLRPGVSKY